MNYWLVRTKSGGRENKKAQFINNDEWLNAYEDKYLDIVKRVEPEDILLLAEESTITHYGLCTENYQDGRHLLVDKWTNLAEPIAVPGNYAATKSIVKLHDPELLDIIKQGIETTQLSHELKINAIFIENFTVFKREQLNFSDGLNVVVGENGTGKSHLLKLLYTLIISVKHVNDNYSEYYKRKVFIEEAISEAINTTLINIFKADELDNLINLYNDECSVKISFGNHSIAFNLTKGGEVSIREEDAKFIDLFKKISAFIPAKEMLSFYEGFVALFENRETSFDAIYYELAKALGLPLLKNIDSYPVENKLLAKLEEILAAKIILEHGRFYLESQGHKTEIALVAEGLRKIATIARLIANGSLTQNSILFWDEPETNLNPKLIRKMAEMLVELSRAGMQIFIATHSLFLIKELEILRAKTDKFKYFGFGFDEQGEIRVSQDENFEYLDDIIILDEALDQDDRFLSKEED